MTLSACRGAPFDASFRSISIEAKTSLLKPALEQHQVCLHDYPSHQKDSNLQFDQNSSSASLGTGVTESERKSSISLLHGADLFDRALICSDEDAAEAELVSKTLEMLSLIRRSTPNPNSLHDLLDGQNPLHDDMECGDFDDELCATDGDDYFVGVDFGEAVDEESREWQQEEWIQRSLVRRGSLPLSSTQTDSEDFDEEEIFDMEL